MPLSPPGSEEPDLPLRPHLPAIARLLSEAGALVLKAEPGAGKTSLIPAYLAEPGRVEGRILLLEPRRVAAVQAAARLAELAGEEPGGRYGYRVRGESKAGPGTKVLVMTEGLLVRLLQEDPGLEGVGLVIFDEFHERGLQADLGLALYREARELRPGLGLLLMSATLAAEDLARRIGAAAYSVPGRSYPIATSHEALGLGPAPGRGFEEGLARLARSLAAEARGDILAFLPGLREIETTARALAGSGLETFGLHGSLPLAEQRRILKPPAGAPRRIILATSIAETSLTVPRVDAVLDSGLARLSRFEPRSGMNRLVTEREAQDRADQRRGRAGRLGPGLCLRAWAASDSLPLRTEPEILRAELSGAVLEAALWGARGAEDLPWLDPPPQAAWSAGRELLSELGALDAGGGPTEFGRRMARLGTEPRLAALVLRGQEVGEGPLAARLAALLSEESRVGGEGELNLLLERILGEDPALGGARREALRLARAAGISLGGPSPLSVAKLVTSGSLLARAFPDRVARRIERLGASARGAEASFRLPGGRQLRASGALAEAEWIVAAEADAGREEGRVFSGSPIAEDEALAALLPLTRTEEFLLWEGRGYKARRRKSAGAILLAETGLGVLPRERVAESFCALLGERGMGLLFPDPPAEAFLARARWFAQASGSPDFPDFAEEGLRAEAADWLGPFIQAGPAEVLPRGSLLQALESRLSYAQRSLLDREAPERLELPSGASRPILYGEGPEPIVEGRVQEFFGLSEQPRLCARPLVLRLLTPAGRPLQVTADLPGFWRGSWAEARKELRGRYPKHEWPEDPSAARPSRSGLKRRA